MPRWFFPVYWLRTVYPKRVCIVDNKYRCTVVMKKNGFIIKALLSQSCGLCKNPIERRYNTDFRASWHKSPFLFGECVKLLGKMHFYSQSERTILRSLFWRNPFKKVFTLRKINFGALLDYQKVEISPELFQFLTD